MNEKMTELTLLEEELKELKELKKEKSNAVSLRSDLAESGTLQMFEHATKVIEGIQEKIDKLTEKKNSMLDM